MVCTPLYSSHSTLNILSKQILSKTPTEFQYEERSVLLKEVNTQNLWSFELGTQEGINFPIWIIVSLQQRDRQDSQNLSNHTSHRPPVRKGQCIIGTGKHPDSVIFLN